MHREYRKEQKLKLLHILKAGVNLQSILNLIFSILTPILNLKVPDSNHYDWTVHPLIIYTFVLKFTETYTMGQDVESLGLWRSMFIFILNMPFVTE
jgi:hypothetical protein